MTRLVECVFAGLALSLPTLSAQSDELEWLRRISPDAGLNHAQVFDLAGDSTGLDCISPATGVFDHYRNDPDPESLAQDNVRTRFEDARGRLWAGTEGGISRLDPGANGVV